MHHFSASPARLLLVLGLGLYVAACTDDFEPPYRVAKLRVLGIRATPPELGFASPSNLQMLAVGEHAGAQLCYAWAFCPFAWSKDGNFRCLDPDLQVDLGTAPTATVGMTTLFQSLANAGKVFDKLGLKSPAGTSTAGQTPDLGCIPGGQAPAGPGASAFGGADLPDGYVLFQVAEAKDLGGSCPTSPAAMLSKPCGDRTTCVAGFKRIGLAPMPGACAPFDPQAEPPCAKDPAVCAAVTECGCDGKNYANACERAAAQVSLAYVGQCRSANTNPDLQGVGMRVVSVDLAKEISRGVDWPVDATPVVAPGGQVQLWPRWDPADIQVIGPSNDPKATKPVEETLLFSWFATAGDFDKSRTWHGAPDVLYTAPTLNSGEASRLVTVWLVVRDERNGTGWLQRQLLVKPGANMAKNPVCSLALGSPGCPAP